MSLRIRTQTADLSAHSRYAQSHVTPQTEAMKGFHTTPTDYLIDRQSRRGFNIRLNDVAKIITANLVQGVDYRMEGKRIWLATKAMQKLDVFVRAFLDRKYIKRKAPWED